jgi:hypothetical protein
MFKNFNFKTGFYVATGLLAIGVAYYALDHFGYIAKWMSKSGAPAADEAGE